MKKVFFALLACLWMLTSTNTTFAQDTKDEKWQSVRFVKFKPGKAKEGLAIGRKYFATAYEQAGYDLTIVEFANSEWDAIILVPLKNGPADQNQDTPKEVQQHLVQLAGGEEALKEVFENYNSLVDHEQWEVGKRW